MTNESDIMVEEITQNAPIEGVCTTIVAFIGGSVKGPVLDPTYVTNWEAFEEIFGGLDFSSKGFYLAHAVDLFFKNGGRKAYIVRATAETTPSPGISYASGLPCIEAVEDISIVAMPDGTNVIDQIALVRHCEKTLYRFAIIDSAPDPRNVGDANDVKLQRQKLISDKGYAAIYYPWIQVQDPRTKRIRIIPPSGAVAGVFTRNDIEKGVHKAPTNVPVIGALDTEVSVDQPDQNGLNRIGVNVIRRFTGRGLLVWGAWTTSSDSIWKNVMVRRAAIYFEQSIANGTEWAAFEPHDEVTWGAVKQSVVEFLNRSWKDGMLQGAKPEEAYFVRCDRTTMTLADIENERLVIEIGVALTRPSEFIVLKVMQDMERMGPRKLVDKTLDAPKKKKHYYTARMMTKE